jgi:hypothetical protein
MHPEENDDAGAVAAFCCGSLGTVGVGIVWILGSFVDWWSDRDGGLRLGLSKFEVIDGCKVVFLVQNVDFKFRSSFRLTNSLPLALQAT